MTARPANWKIATLALSEQGGASRAIDTEDVAALCWAWAPSRFGWQKYPQYPDIRRVGEALRDAKKAKNGQLVQGDERHGGWRLTSAGNEWARANRSLIGSGALARSGAVLHRDEDLRLVALRRTGAFNDWIAGHSVDRFTAAHALELTADAPRGAVRDRLVELQNLAAQAADRDIEEFLEWLSKAE